MTDLHAVFSLAQPQQADERVLALRSDAGVLVLGVVQQSFDDRFDQTGVQSGSLRLLTHPPQHALWHQTNVTRLVLQTLWEESRQTVNSASLMRVSPTNMFEFLHNVYKKHLMKYNQIGHQKTSSPWYWQRFLKEVLKVIIKKKKKNV